jgi:hypothetical protein
VVGKWKRYNLGEQRGPVFVKVVDGQIQGMCIISRTFALRLVDIPKEVILYLKDTLEVLNIYCPVSNYFCQLMNYGNCSFVIC